MTYPSGAHVAYSYDAAGRVASVSVNGKILIAGITYFPFGEPEGWAMANGGSYHRSFDKDGRIAALALPAGDTIALSYDAASRVAAINETGLAPKAFAYDALNRLANYTSGATVQAYAYDVDGNRTAFALGDGKTKIALIYTYDKASNHLLSIAGSSKENFAYDANGNLLSHTFAISRLQLSVWREEPPRLVFGGSDRHKRAHQWLGPARGRDYEQGANNFRL
jgi:YD repeat-containing protein